MKAPLPAAFRDSGGRRVTLTLNSNEYVSTAHVGLTLWDNGYHDVALPAGRLGPLDRPRPRGSLYGAELTAVPVRPPNGAR